MSATSRFTDGIEERGDDRQYNQRNGKGDHEFKDGRQYGDQDSQHDKHRDDVGKSFHGDSPKESALRSTLGCARQYRR